MSCSVEFTDACTLNKPDFKKTMDAIPYPESVILSRSCAPDTLRVVSSIMRTYVGMIL